MYAAHCISHYRTVLSQKFSVKVRPCCNNCYYGRIPDGTMYLLKGNVLCMPVKTQLTYPAARNGRNSVHFIV